MKLPNVGDRWMETASGIVQIMTVEMSPSGKRILVSYAANDDPTSVGTYPLHTFLQVFQPEESDV